MFDVIVHPGRVLTSTRTRACPRHDQAPRGGASRRRLAPLRARLAGRRRASARRASASLPEQGHLPRPPRHQRGWAHRSRARDSRETARELAELGVVVRDPDELRFAFTVPAEQSGWGGCNCFEDVYVLPVDSSATRFAVGGGGDRRVVGADGGARGDAPGKDPSVVPRVPAYVDAFFHLLETEYSYERPAPA